jgi:AraC-like DNA-binding protein
VEHIYREIPAPAVLAPYLRCFWTETTAGDHRPGTMRVLPDGCIDVVWVAGREPFVVGAATRSMFPLLPPATPIVGARFQPGMMAGLLGAPADVVANLDVPVSELWGGDGRPAPARFDDSGAVPDGLSGLQALLTARLCAVGEAGDPLVTTLARLLVGEPGTPLASLVDRAGLGERQVRRRFEAAIGYGPKTFQRIMRFQRWLDLATAAEPAARILADLAADAGYADQAHLTREVARLAGLPPAALLAAEAPPAPRPELPAAGAPSAP